VEEALSLLRKVPRVFGQRRSLIINLIVPQTPLQFIIG
jgi:hypothetical protein